MMPTSIATDVGPNFGAVGGTGDLRAIVGALLTYGLIVAVLMLVISAATCAIASNSGSWHTAQKAKAGCFVALGGATATAGRGERERREQHPCLAQLHSSSPSQFPTVQ